MPEIRFLTNNYWVASVRRNNRKQFQLVDSMLFGQVRWAVVRIFVGQGWLGPLEKNWPIRPWLRCKTMADQSRLFNSWNLLSTNSVIY